MIHTCIKCKKLIEDLDYVEMMVEGTYHQLASINSFAMDKNMKFRTGTLSHADCENPKADYCEDYA